MCRIEQIWIGFVSAFKFCKRWENACNDIITCERSDKKSIAFAEDILENTERDGFVSADQAEWIGKLHHTIVCEGVYKEDNWWT